MVGWFVVIELFFGLGLVILLIIVGIFIVLFTRLIMRPNFWFVINRFLVIVGVWLPVVVWLDPFTRLG